MDRRLDTRNLRRLDSFIVEETRTAMAGTERSFPVDMAFDSMGHSLYARVASLPDFGMSRAEAELLRDAGREMLALAGDPREILDLKAGTGVAARPLLDNVERYVAVEKCPPVLDRALGDLSVAFPRLELRGIVGDANFALDASTHDMGPRLLVMLGGALGRLEPTQARLELSRIRGAMSPDDRLLVGMDLAKEPYRLHAAYNDPGGAYSAFVRNALRRANREVGTDFDLSSWTPVVEVQTHRGRVEIRLESRLTQRVAGGRTGESWIFERGESILIERASKPTEGQFAALALSAGFRVAQTWSQADQGFSMFLLASETARYLA